MRGIAFLVFLFTTLSSVIGQGNFPVWDEDYAWGGDQYDHLKDIVENDKDYSITSAGDTYTSSNTDISGNSNGLADYWIVKIDTAETILFEKILGGDTTEILTTLLLTDDDGFLLAGSSASGKNGDKSQNSKGGFDFWIVKLSETGNVQWDRTIGGNKDDFLHFAMKTDDGGYLLGGSSLSDQGGDKSDPNLGYEDYWMVKVNGSGTVLWDRTYGGDSTDVLTSIAQKGNSFYVGGYSASDSSGTKLTDSYRGFDNWIVKTSKNGTEQNQWLFGGDEDDFLEEVRAHPQANGVWVAGTSYSGNTGNKTSGNNGLGDFWIYTLSADGIKVIDVSFGSSQLDLCKDMETSPEGSAIIGGSSAGANGSKNSGTNGGIDNWIIKVDTFGVKYWDVNYGGAQDDSLEAIFIKCDRGLLVGSASESPISGDRTKVNYGDFDYWAYKLNVPTHPYFRAEDICTGVPLSFYDESDVWPDWWEWDFDDPTSANNNSEDQHPIHTYSKEGVYNVVMKIQEGCQKDTTYSRQITVYDNTVLGNLDLGDGFSVCNGTPFTLFNKKSAPAEIEYVWSTGDTVDVLNSDSIGIYSVTMSDRNCSVTDKIEVGDCPNIFIPNAFTPNGDEINDEYFMVGYGIVEFDLMIFDRWGMLLFHSKDINERWDGTFKGNQAQIDVYVYKVIFRGIGTLQEQKIGHISLLR